MFSKYKDSFLLAIIIILFILNVILGYLLTSSRSEKETEYSLLKNKIAFDSVLVSNLINFTKTSCIINQQNYIDLFYNIFPEWKGSIHVVVYVSESQCKTCLKKALIDFSLLQSRTNFKDFVILGDFENEQRYNNLINQLNIQIEHKYFKLGIEEIRKIEYPIIFIVDENSLIKYFFIPDLFPDLRSRYFYEILEPYLKSKATN
jgi:hypothetical protein